MCNENKMYNNILNATMSYSTNFSRTSRNYSFILRFTITSLLVFVNVSSSKLTLRASEGKNIYSDIEREHTVSFAVCTLTKRCEHSRYFFSKLQAILTALKWIEHLRALKLPKIIPPKQNVLFITI